MERLSCQPVASDQRRWGWPVSSRSSTCARTMCSKRKGSGSGTISEYSAGKGAAGSKGSPGTGQPHRARPPGRGERLTVPLTHLPLLPLGAAGIAEQIEGGGPCPASEHQGAHPWRAIGGHRGQLQPGGAAVQGWSCSTPPCVTAMPSSYRLDWHPQPPTKLQVGVQPRLRQQRLVVVRILAMVRSFLCRPCRGIELHKLTAGIGQRHQKKAFGPCQHQGW